MADTYDLVILGGGCAGLSLAMALAAEGERCPRTLIIESRAEYTNDRTWCYWKDASSGEPYSTRHSWQTMQVTHAGQSVSLDCGATPYQMVEAQDFYAAAQTLIDQQPNIALRLGASVIGEPSFIGSGNDVWRIRTNAGNVTARSIVDTRAPQQPRLDGATLWQSFYGREVECSVAVFNPLSLDLMNFLPPNTRDVPFVYVLPITPTRALIEVTIFGAMPLKPEALCARLDVAIAERVGSAPFKTLRSEHGILPMGLAQKSTGRSATNLHKKPEPTHKSYVRVGVMAGGARPSTGYAFQRIQCWADNCAHALVSDGHPIGHQPDPLPLRLMDQIFLDVLRANPSRGGAIFFSLFSRADPARVIRFLSGDAGLIDSLAVIAAMPVLPFVKAALAMTRRGVRISEVQNAV